MVHSDGKSDEKTIVDWVVERFPELKTVGEAWHAELSLDEFPRAGIAHRLDRDTSGCLLIAKNQEAFEYIKELFKEHSIQKTYHAVVYGWVEDDSGTIDAPIGRSGADFRRWSAQRGARGKMREAVTEYQVLRRFELPSLTPPQRGEDHEKFTLLALRPKTGRTHQIRVHMKYLNHPIVADDLYAGKKVEQSHSLGISRHALHALSLEFIDPEGERVYVEAPYPEDFQRALQS